jgi:Na+-transporting methylmalonyl-CoA/oxaloacetate decarboxylase gamma subunit
MEAFNVSVATYVLTTAFALGIAVIIKLMAVIIKKLGLEEHVETPPEAQRVASDEKARIAAAVAAIQARLK